MFNNLRDQLCRDVKFSFDGKNIYLHVIWFTCKETKIYWITRTINLEGIDFARQPTCLGEQYLLMQTLLVSLISKELEILMLSTMKQHVWTGKQACFGKSQVLMKRYTK